MVSGFSAETLVLKCQDLDTETVFKERCDAGNTEQCFLLGSYYNRNKKHKESKKILESTCNKGHATACMFLKKWYGTK